MVTSNPIARLDLSAPTWLPTEGRAIKDRLRPRIRGLLRRSPATPPIPTGATSQRVVPTRRLVEVIDGRDVRLPAVVVSGAAWSWRLLIILAALVALLSTFKHLLLLIVPFATALLATALLLPIAQLLRRRGLSRGISTLVTILFALVVVGGVGFFVVDRAVAGYPQLADETSRAVTNVQNYLTGAPFHLQRTSVENIGSTITKGLKSHQGQITSGVISAGKTAVDVLTGLVLFLFLTIFLVYDGDRVWDWVCGLFPRDAAQLAHGAGQRAWRTLSGYVTGQFYVALFHSVVISATLLFEGAPLVAPLALIVFLFSFVPIIGALVAGAFAVVVVLVAVGPVQAIVLIVMFIIIDQVESHILQPLVVGKAVRLHPIAIAATLTGGALLAGLPGAIFGVPFVAVVNAAVKYLSGREDIDGNPVSREARLVDVPETTEWTTFEAVAAEAPHSDPAHAPLEGPADGAHGAGSTEAGGRSSGASNARHTQAIDSGGTSSQDPAAVRDDAHQEAR